MLTKDRAHLADLQRRILDAEHTLSALRVQESVVKERLHAYKYPVSTLPNELIAEIFLHFLPKYPICPPLAGPNSPIILTHICRSWRDIAIATPRLWRAVSLSGRRSWANPNNINLWFSRAGCLPLALRLNEADGYDPAALALMRAVLPYRSRCEYLELRLDDYIPGLPELEGEFPLLRHLDLELDDDPPYGEIVFHNFPMLRSVVLDVLAARWIVLPWRQLTSLSLHSISFHDCVAVLRKVINLLECNLNIIVHDEKYIVNPPIKLPHLKLLKVDGDGSMNAFLGSFVLPALSTLHVCEMLLGPDPIFSLTSFISTSECHLRQLRITCTHPKSQPYTSYCAALTSVQELSLGDDPDRRPLHLLSGF
ncbi:F-box domain-containing protein [Favolaschia claudopus]|uniref:F-box domain-containing protein n=1 Tax=Favolaschia claudopus TaxID=2862362 RepID=A0AAW0AZK8_9AGAR